MRKRRLSLAALLVGLAIAGSSGVYCLTGRTTEAQRRVANPKIHVALDALREARIELKEAPHEYRGHRKAALEAVDKAIEQLDIIREWER